MRHHVRGIDKFANFLHRIDNISRVSTRYRDQATSDKRGGTGGDNSYKAKYKDMAGR